MLLFIDQKQAGIVCEWFVSIHLMLLFIYVDDWIKDFTIRFNTSHVTLYLFTG